MSDTKQVKVDNWGIFFLQRLKHFFNRTDYCDLTLQFQDNAQLKVHRLVLNACTEYFELLERTCEMYEDCLIMPDDLQADVVVPIINFMYTGQLDYKYELLDKLYQTALIMNMSVLTKLLDAQRNTQQTPEPPKYQATSNYTRTKRPYTKAFEVNTSPPQKKVYIPSKKQVGAQTPSGSVVRTPVSRDSRTYSQFTPKPKKSSRHAESSRPTRYELPEELDTEEVFANSFTDISYESKPLMIHPHAKKAVKPDFNALYSETSSSQKFEELKKIMKGPSTSTIDIVECKRVGMTRRNDSMFEESIHDSFLVEDREELDHNQSVLEDNHLGHRGDGDQLFDQILETTGPKITIEPKQMKHGSDTSSIDHAKIISEVLKRYPHLVKSNKNIKLKIVNTANKSTSEFKQFSRKGVSTLPPNYAKEIKIKTEEPSRDYHTDVVDTKEAARLISLGAENVKGPWICLICGTPGRALHFPSYYKFRRHLIDTHNEKPPSNLCEYCGLKSNKRNHLLYHMYTKHGIPPPPSYHFPKCDQCSYVALTESFLIKHKASHNEPRDFHCNVCLASFKTSTLLLHHIQTSGHKISGERRPNLQCIYCLKVFLRENYLFSHLKLAHKAAARSDGIIENSDEDEPIALKQNVTRVKYEPVSYEGEEDSNDGQYQIQQRPDGNIQVLSRKTVRPPVKVQKQKILNQDFTSNLNQKQQAKKSIHVSSMQHEYLQEEDHSVMMNEESSLLGNEIVVLNDSEYIHNQSMLKSDEGTEYVISDVINSECQEELPPIHIAGPSSSNSILTENTVRDSQIMQQTKLPSLVKKAGTINQPIQIVVSNEHEYKALMASNPSIIFDDGTQSKTLSVLTHEGSLNAGITLNSAQANEMMIIHENYPITVSENVTTENPNIVVLYSHPVADHNKQYLVNTQYSQPQIVTSQGLEAQFVQTSTVLAHNYGTITSASPMVGGQILMQETIDSWQANVQHNAESANIQLNESDVQSNVIVSEDQAQVLHSEQICTNAPSVDQDMTELAEIQIVQQVSPEYTDQSEVVETEIQPHENSEHSVIVNNNVNSMITGEEQVSCVAETNDPVLPEVMPSTECEAYSIEPVQQESMQVDETHSTLSNDDNKQDDVETSHSQDLLNSNNDQGSEEMVQITAVDSEEVISHSNVNESTEIVQNLPIVIKEITDHSVLENPQTIDTENVIPDSENTISVDNVEPVPDIEMINNVKSVQNVESIQDAEIIENVEIVQTFNGNEPEPPLEEVHTESSSIELDSSETNAELTQNEEFLIVNENEVQAQETTKEDSVSNEVLSTDVSDTPVNPQILHLASEWSEDEELPKDAASKDTNESETNTLPIEETCELPSETADIEESIENIQQEMEKQMACVYTVTTDVDGASITDDLSQNSTNVSSQGSAITVAQQLTSDEPENKLKGAAIEKISSLLNDWDENESQEDSCKEDSPVENDVAAVEETIEAKESVVIKDDKIKSLVSDWDEDEEENKD